MPCSAANETAFAIRSSIDSRVTPSAASFASEIGDSITLAWTPSSTSASASAATAREKPHTSASRPAPAISSTARQSSSETRGNPASIRSIPSPSIAAGELELLLGVEDDADGLLAVAERRVVEADRAADRVRVVQRARPDQLPVSRQRRRPGTGRASRRPPR